jgi:hypothetical protein
MSGEKKIAADQVDLELYVLKTLLTQTLQQYALVSQLFSGNYNDLSNKPDLTQFALQNQLFSGNYNDLSNLPDLAQYLDTAQITDLIESTPTFLKASTDWFDPSSPNGSFTNYTGDKGILSSVSYSVQSERTELTLNFSQSISGKSPITVFYTDQTNVAQEADYTKPVFRIVNSTQLVLGIREIDGAVGKIRIELIFI